MTISDVILHIRYTAREAGDPLGPQATNQSLLFNLRYDFPTDWSAFVKGTGSFAMTLEKQYFPYMVQSAKIVTIDGLTLYVANAAGKVISVTPTVDLGELSTSLNKPTRAVAKSGIKRTFQIVKYGCQVGSFAA